MEKNFHHSKRTSIPPGTVDIYGAKMRQRQNVLNIIKDVYENFGFDPLHTPILENSIVFNGHHGEGEKLLFNLTDSTGNELVNRYDLTVPLARFVTMHPEINRPYKRYQLEPVFRDDNPDKGHFREFTQCDGDIVGIKDLISDAEIISLAYSGLKKLGFNDFIIRINHRNIIQGIAEKAGITSKSGILEVQRALDFSDKITKKGIDGIKTDLQSYGATKEVVDAISEMITIDGDIDSKLIKIESAFEGQSSGLKGVSELKEIIYYLDPKIKEHVVIDLTLSRGADYYTGFILEGIIPEVAVGAVLGGGRYDNLIEACGGNSEPAVGMAFGLERIILAMEEKKLFDKIKKENRTLVFSKTNNSNKKKILYSVLQAREAGFSVDFLTEDNISIADYAKERTFDLLIICNDSTVEYIELELSATDFKLEISQFFD